MSPLEEFAIKLGRLRALLEERGASGFALQKQTNLAWLLGGAECLVGRTTDLGNCVAVVTPEACRVLMNNVEATRLLTEELAELPIEPVVFPWHEDATAATVATLLGEGGLSDTGLAGAAQAEASLIGLQAPLTEAERARYRQLGRDAASAVSEAMLGVCPGMSEHEIAGRLAGCALSRGLNPAVVLVAVDARTLEHRHPLPTGLRCERYAMGVLVARRGGLHASLTRSVHFGPISEALARRHLAAQRVDAALLAATVPGATAGEAFAAAQAAYASAGYPEEWTLHHQGGATGYQPRTWRAMPGGVEPIREGQAFAWNPTVRGTKSEDTVLATGEDVEILTDDGEWPRRAIRLKAREWARPEIAEL